jgi:phage regulator Rha-like protein
MSEVVSYKEVEEKITTVRGEAVILDRDVAALYGVETKEVNQAVRNNLHKFPRGYVIDLETEEWESLRSKFLTLETNGKGQYSKYKPKAFTEKGLYMLATILRGKRAAETTIAIVEPFTKMRELSRALSQLPDVPEKDQQKAIMQKAGELFTEILADRGLEVTGDETTLEVNLAFMKLKHTTTREKRDNKDA